MDMEKFIAELHERNFGVVSFNTYIQNDINRCFIMIAERGSVCRFSKSECDDVDLNYTLQNMIVEVLKLKGEL
jgi:hypothetical protein